VGTGSCPIASDRTGTAWGCAYMPGQLASLGAAAAPSAGAVVVLDPESAVELVPESVAALLEVLESLVCA
jgi:hypothetical protein